MVPVWIALWAAVIQAVKAASSVPLGCSGFFGSLPAGHCGPVAAPEEPATDEPEAPLALEALGALEPAVVVEGAPVEAAGIEAAEDPSDGAPWVVIRPVVPASADGAAR